MTDEKKPLEIPSDAPSNDQVKEAKPAASKGGEPRPEESGREPKVADKVKDEKVVVPAKFKKLVEEIEEMSIMDMAELVKILEKKFGVSPVVPTAVGTSTGVGAASKEEEKSEFTIELKSVGEQKINVIKVVREITGKGLKEAKDIVDSAPKVVKENVKKEEAEEIKKKFETAGATVELK